MKSNLKLAGRVLLGSILGNLNNDLISYSLSTPIPYSLPDLLYGYFYSYPFSCYSFSSSKLNGLIAIEEGIYTFSFGCSSN